MSIISAVLHGLSEGIVADASIPIPDRTFLRRIELPTRGTSHRRSTIELQKLAWRLLGSSPPKPSEL